MIKEFREFIYRGNVLDLAVAVMMGAAFTAIVKSLVDDIIMPIVGVIIGGLDFAALSWQIGEATVKYGTFLQAVVNFLIVAWIIFLVVRTVNRLQAARGLAEAAEAPAEPSAEERLLTEIRDLLKDR